VASQFGHRVRVVKVVLKLSRQEVGKESNNVRRINVQVEENLHGFFETLSAEQIKCVECFDVLHPLLSFTFRVVFELAELQRELELIVPQKFVDLVAERDRSQSPHVVLGRQEDEAEPATRSEAWLLVRWVARDRQVLNEQARLDRVNLNLPRR
jgi:hypothetical protein